MRWFSLFGVLGVAASCSPPQAPPEEIDVVQACQVRAQWTRSTHVECTSCVVNAKSTPCSCNPDIGACHAEAQAEADEVDCTTDVKACAQSCGADCACVDHCYAAHAECRKVASATAGCVADACLSSCR